MRFLDENNSPRVTWNQFDTFYAMIMIIGEDSDFMAERVEYMTSFMDSTVFVEMSNDVVMAFPMYWSVLCTGDEYFETLRFSEFFGREMDLLFYNPINSSMIESISARVIAYGDPRRWVVPHLNAQQMLCCPVPGDPKNRCVMVGNNNSRNLAVSTDLG